MGLALPPATPASPGECTDIDTAPFSAAVTLVRGLGAERERCERELTDAGLPLAFFHRGAWVRARRMDDAWMVAVRGANGRCAGAIPLSVHRSRALPGHLIVRAERCGSTLPSRLAPYALDALAELAGSARVLRLEVELFERDEAIRNSLERALGDRGFHRASTTRCYEVTLALDLAADEASLFSALNHSTRRDVRLPERYPLQVRPITELSLASRLDELVAETMARSGGGGAHGLHLAMLEASRAAPTLSRVVGLFRTDLTGPAALVAFAWAALHGDHAAYHAGASTRCADVKGGLAYPLLWDVIAWSRARGARWFDMGGFTVGSLADGAPLGGISDFKRRFAREVVTVGSDWVMERHAARAALARATIAGASWVSRLRERWT